MIRGIVGINASEPLKSVELLESATSYELGSLEAHLSGTSGRCTPYSFLAMLIWSHAELTMRLGSTKRYCPIAIS